MLKIPEAEARRLLSCPLRCEGDFAWRAARNWPASLMLSVGIVDLSGVATPMEVELRFRSGASTPTKYLFSVYLRQAYGKSRVYQLEVIHAPRHSKDLHSQSHEHIGDRRLNGQAEWQIWGYHEVLAHFCSRTNITFEAPVPDPANFCRARKP